MLPFYLGKIWFSTNRPLSLDTEKSCRKKFSQVQTMSQGKQGMRKGKVFALAQEAGERKGKSMGCRVVGPMGPTMSSVLFLAVMLTGNCAMMILFVHSLILPFLEKQSEELLHQRQKPLLSFQPSAPCT